MFNPEPVSKEERNRLFKSTQLFCTRKWENKAESPQERERTQAVITDQLYNKHKCLLLTESVFVEGISSVNMHL